MGNLSEPHLSNVTVNYYFTVPADTVSTTQVSVVTVVVSVVVSVEQEANMATTPRIRSFFMLQK
jgi:voltage-gated potassium channel Kch